MLNLTKTYCVTRGETTALVSKIRRDGDVWHCPFDDNANVADNLVCGKCGGQLHVVAVISGGTMSGSYPGTINTTTETGEKLQPIIVDGVQLKEGETIASTVAKIPNFPLPASQSDEPSKQTDNEEKGNQPRVGGKFAKKK